MKRKNIEVGEYVVLKQDGSVRTISSIVEGRAFLPNIRGPVPFEWLRRPRISDLSVGDVFEFYDKRKRQHHIYYVDEHCVKTKTDGLKYVFMPQNFPMKTKVKIISLAAATQESEKRSVTVWVNCFPDGHVEFNSSPEIAYRNTMMRGREACIPVTIEWVKGQGLEDG